MCVGDITIVMHVCVGGIIIVMHVCVGGICVWGVYVYTSYICGVGPGWCQVHSGHLFGEQFSSE